MMRLNQFFQLVMVALLLFTFQEVTVHSKQHLVETVSECHLCDASEHLDLHHHQKNTPLVMNEHFAIKVNKIEEKQIVKAAYDLTQKPLQRMVDFDGLVNTQFDTLSLGYYATAPPCIFS